GAQRALRTLHQRRQAQWTHSQGSRTGIADAGGSDQAAGGDRQADARPLRQEGRREEGAGEEGCNEKSRGKKDHQEGCNEEDRGEEVACEEGREEGGGEEGRRACSGAGAAAAADAKALRRRAPRGQEGRRLTATA